MSVDGAVCGNSSGRSGGEARDVAGEALVMGIGVEVGRGGVETGGDCDKGACDEGECGSCGCEIDGGDKADSDSCDGYECVGAGRDSLDDSGSVDDASETTRDHAVEGENLIMRLKVWEITQLWIQIWRLTSYVKQLKKVNYGIVVGLKVANVISDGCERRNVMCKEISQQRSSRTTCEWSNIWSQKKSELK